MTTSSSVTTEPCRHGMDLTGCAYCRRTSPAPVEEPLTSGGVPRSRQRLLDDLCDLLGIARHAETPGSNPSRVFGAAAKRAKVMTRVTEPTMPAIGAAIATKAGLEWGPGCDDRSQRREAARVTAAGIAVVHEALVILMGQPPKRGPKAARTP